MDQLHARSMSPLRAHLGQHIYKLIALRARLDTVQHSGALLPLLPRGLHSKLSTPHELLLVSYKSGGALEHAFVNRRLASAAWWRLCVLVRHPLSEGVHAPLCDLTQHS